MKKLVGTSDVKRTYFNFWESDDGGGWRATEAGTENDIVGEGEKPSDAIMDYLIQFQNRDEE